jgi:hypothetical protein
MGILLALLAVAGPEFDAPAPLAAVAQVETSAGTVALEASIVGAVSGVAAGIGTLAGFGLGWMAGGDNYQTPWILGILGAGLGMILGPVVGVPATALFFGGLGSPGAIAFTAAIAVAAGLSAPIGLGVGFYGATLFDPFFRSMHLDLGVTAGVGGTIGLLVTPAVIGGLGFAAEVWLGIASDDSVVGDSPTREWE